VDRNWEKKQRTQSTCVEGDSGGEKKICYYYELRANFVNAPKRLCHT